MRKVDRASVKKPKSLLDGGAGAKELDRFKAHRDAPPPADGSKKKSFTFKAYKSDDVRMALEALFHEKCAYCETQYAHLMPVDVEHYRPKGAVAEDENHGGYWWVAANWDNLLPSCIDCNRQRGQVLVNPSDSLAELAISTKPVLTQAGKKDSFPIQVGSIRTLAEVINFASERPLLLDPCRDEPSESLGYSFDGTSPNGLMLPAGDHERRQRGAVSIQIYGLNRLKLVQDRTRVLRTLEFLGEVVIELAASIEALEHPDAEAALSQLPAAKVPAKLRLLRDRTLAEMKALTQDDAPYSAMAKAWLEQFKTKLA
jgi:hypothetical protein